MTYHNDVCAHVNRRRVGGLVLAPDDVRHGACEAAQPLVGGVDDEPLLLHIEVVGGLGVVGAVPHILQGREVDDSLREI